MPSPERWQQQQQQQQQQPKRHRHQASSSKLFPVLSILLIHWSVGVDAFTVVYSGVGTGSARNGVHSSPVLHPLGLSSGSTIHASKNDDGETDETATIIMDLDPYGTPQALCEALDEGQAPVVDQLRGELRRIGLRDDDIVAGDGDEALELAKRLFITKYLPMEDVPAKYLVGNAAPFLSSLDISQAKDDVRDEPSVEGAAQVDDSPSDDSDDASDAAITGTASANESEEDPEIEMLENVAAEIKRLEEALLAKIEEEDEVDIVPPSTTNNGNDSVQDGISVGEGIERDLTLQDDPTPVAESEKAKQTNEADLLEARKKAYMERMLEAKRLAELAEEENATPTTSAGTGDKVSAKEERLEAELLSLEVQLEAERQRLDQVRLEVEHLSLVDDEEAQKRKEEDESDSVRARIASSYNRYATLDQQGAINKPNNARKEEVEHRLESQKRAARRLAELSSPEYQRLSKRYNRYARLDDVTARLNELVAAKEDRNAEDHQVKKSKDASMVTANAQQQKEPEEQMSAEAEELARTAPRRAGPRPLSTTESFREQRQWKKEAGGDVDILDGGWEKLDINWKVSARHFFGSENRRLDGLGASAFDHRFALQLHLLDESKVECELRVVEVNTDIVIRNANIFVYCTDEMGNRVEAHALEIENDCKEKTLFASDSETEIGSASFGRGPFFTTPKDSGARVEVSRQMLLQQAMGNGLRVHASFDVNTVEQVTSRIFSV